MTDIFNEKCTAIGIGTVYRLCAEFLLTNAQGTSAL